MLILNTIKNPVIHIIGAGGTGGFTYEYIARLLAGRDIPIHLYDGDLVETKNLKRQNFSLDHVTHHKVSALLSKSEGILSRPNTTIHPEYITDADDFLVKLLTEEGTPIVISAVDNVSTRKLINQVLDEYPDDWYAIDSGNNDTGGQVVVYTNTNVQTYTPFTEPIEVNLPNMLEVYPELQTIQDDNPGLVQSCDDVVESQPQAMMANVRNADIIANIVITILEDNGQSRPHLEGNVYESNLQGFTTRVREQFK